MKTCFDGAILDRGDVPELVNQTDWDLGAAVFETFRLHQGTVERLDLHLRRLLNSAEVWSISNEAEFEDIKSALMSYFKMMKGDWRAKVMMTNAHWWCQLFPLELPAPEAYEHGVVVDGAVEMRIKPDAKAASPLYQQYMSSASGVFETIFFDKKEDLLEGNITNVFAVLASGTVVTPNDGILLGITRQAVIKKLKSYEISVEERPIKKSELKTAQAMFLTNSIKGVVPVSAFEDWQSQDFELAQKLHHSLFNN